MRKGFGLVFMACSKNQNQKADAKLFLHLVEDLLRLKSKATQNTIKFSGNHLSRFLIQVKDLHNHLKE